MTTNADTKTNPYYDRLFTSFKQYISSNYSLKDTTLAAAGNAKLSKFTAGGSSTSGFINIAGNYKYSCIVPKESGIPPNYIGVLKENDALTGFMDELYSFTMGKGRINCTRAAEELYTKAYGTDDKGNPQAYRINFTDGMPRELHIPALREVHTDITKQLNSIIDYAIATGQTATTKEYDDVLISRFLNIFFTEDGIPRYYALRTGILPSAIAYTRYLQAKGDDSSITFDTHYKDFEEEIDHLAKGLHFIPIGRSSQFLQSKVENERLYWYPFHSQDAYSYKYDTSAGSKSEEKYVVNKGFNHFMLTENDQKDTAQSKKLITILNSVSVQTDAINAALPGNDRTVLSYESCLSDIPAPNRICVLDSYDTVVSTDPDGDGNLALYRKGNLTETIRDIDSWANIKGGGENTYKMHPLLNYSGANNKDKTNNYLYVKAEPYGPKITEAATLIKGKNTSTEMLSYYETGFDIQPETNALNHMNFYSSREDDKSVDPYALEFGIVSHDLYSVSNGGSKLELNKSLAINPATFGVLGKLPGNSDDKDELAWQTVTCGIISSIYDVRDSAVKNNLLFRVENLSGGDNLNGNEVPTVNMNITTIHYGGPYGGENDTNKNHGCNFYRDDGFGGGYDCHGVNYVETGQDYHEGRYKKKLPDKDYNENKTVSVNFNTSEAVLGEYDSKVVYNLSNMTMISSTVQGYYYTVHILAEDGAIKTDVKINPADGTLDASGNNLLQDDGNDVSKETRTSRYGTGLQYFFGGNCDKAIFESYYKKGLTLFQLLDPRSDAYEKDKGKKYGRVINGLKYANRTFEWDYNVILKAWHLALWIMNGYDSSSKNRSDYGTILTEKLYTTNDSGLALAAFFDYIYSTSNVKLMLGPSLKQINNAVGPYGSNTSNDGTGEQENNNNPLIMNYGEKGADSGDNYDNKTLRGKSWNVINGNRGTNRGLYDSLNDHARVAAAVFVNSDTKLHNDSKTNIGKNGVGKFYWSKGDVSKTTYKNTTKISQWGEHNADARRPAIKSDGYLHLDHYSWGWQAVNDINNATNQFSPTCDIEHLWRGVFMIHALNPTRTEKEPTGTNGEGYNSPFNWHMGPFHEVSPEAKEHTNEYGVRNELSPWTESGDDGDCNTGISGNMTKWKQAWDGINWGWTWDNQNPNIRIRLPMLWRYLKSLREKGVYTDGQLMPCGIELHYCSYRKALLTSITNAEHTLPIHTGFITATEEKQLTPEESANNTTVANANIASWQTALRRPSSVTFAEVMYDTYAITKNTISTWYTLMKTPEYYHPLIKNILETVAVHSDKLTAMHRTKRYIDSISTKLGTTGKTLYNIPILPSVSLFGATETNKDGTVNSIVVASEMGMTYNVLPDFNLTSAKANNVAIGVTHQPTLPPGQSANQFTAISTGLYAGMSDFDGDTIGWIVPIPTKANLALLDAYDGAWRNDYSSVIPITMNTIHALLEKLSNINLHWIGWVKSDTLPCLNNDATLNSLIHICYKDNATTDSDKADIAAVPMVSLKITPYYNDSTDCNIDGAKCAQSNNAQTDCAKITPFSVKFEIDTRGTDDSLKLIMIRDNMNDNINYTIYQLSNEVSIQPKTTTKAVNMTTYMTTVSYDKDEANIPPVLRPL